MNIEVSGVDEFVSPGIAWIIADGVEAVIYDTLVAAKSGIRPCHHYGVGR